VDAHNPALSALIVELGLASRVHLLGERADVPRLTAALDVATCSSIGEGFPNAVGEAMACGIVVVSTDVGDTATVLLDSGVVVPPYDPAGLADGWRTVLAMAPAERAALGRRARERVIEQYDAAGIAARYAALYRELAAAGPAAESRAA
jgi:glycosyltransferase involved in cell wall biosynthesis